MASRKKSKSHVSEEVPLAQIISLDVEKSLDMEKSHTHPLKTVGKSEAALMWSRGGFLPCSGLMYSGERVILRECNPILMIK